MSMFYKQGQWHALAALGLAKQAQQPPPPKPPPPPPPKTAPVMGGQGKQVDTLKREGVFL